MKRHIATLSLAALTAALCAQTQVAAFNPGAVAGGVNYALPKTALKVCVSAIKVETVAGELAPYAKRYLHIDNARTESSTEWAMTQLEVYQEGIPDPEKYYTVKLKDKTTAPLVQLSPAGVLLAVNTTAEDAEASPRTSPRAGRYSHPDGAGRMAAGGDRVTSRGLASQYQTEEMLAATTTSKLAELTAQEILDIRESKNSIRRGQVEAMPRDGESLRIVLGELDAQEDALTRLFTGYSDTTHVWHTFTLVPEGDVSDSILFRFSRRLGFVDPDDLAGSPLTISVRDRHSVPLPTEDEAAKRKITGLVYNIPGMARVTLSSLDGGAALYDKDLPFAQFGTVDVLSPTLFNKGATTRLTLNPATGGVSHLEQ